MSLRGPLGQILLLLLIVASGAAVFLALYEKRSVDDWDPPSGLVVRQPYLAAERMLTAMDIEVDQISALEQAADLSPSSVLIVPAGRGSVTLNARTAVRQFVTNGGHLLVESERWENRDPLFEALNLQRSEAPDADIDLDWMIMSWTDQFRFPLESVESSDPTLLLVRWDEESEPLLVTSLGGELLAADDAVRRIDGTDGTRMLQRRMGKGLITAVNDISFAQNWRIGRNDNAELLWRMVNEQAGPTEVTWFRTRPVKLWAWLQNHALPVLITLSALLVLFIWQGLPRFGPTIADPSNERRRLSDHLSASGRFLWSAGQRANLGRAAAACAYDAVARRYPHLRNMQADDQIRFLCTRFDLPPSHAQALVKRTQVTDAAEILRLTRSCRHLHRVLSGAQADSNELIDKDHR